MASLVAMAANRIPEQRHRNYGTVSKEEKLDKQCFLVWFHSFVKRCFTKNIYCPSIYSYLASSCMGVEWESGALPDEVLEKHMLYSSALREDLLYVTSHDENLCNIVAIAKCGFSAVHNIINLACPIVKTRVPDTTLLIFKEGTCITRHVKHVHEYVLQSALVGISMSDWQQWQIIVRGLPTKVRTMLDTSAISEISQPGFDRETNLPFNLCLENAAAFIMSECSDKGMTKDISAAKAPKFIDHAQVLKFYAKAKKCFYCGDDHLKSDCPKYKLVDKKTGVEKPPYIKPPFVKKNINEISSEIPLGEDVVDEIDDSKDEVDIVDMAQQFISSMNLKDEDEDEDDNIDDSSLDSGMPYSFIASMAEHLDIDHAVPFCRDCNSYDHPTSKCPLNVVDSSM